MDQGNNQDVEMEEKKQEAEVTVEGKTFVG